MTSDNALSPQQIAARYFEMWNTGDASIASQILHPDWIDHAHPEVTGPHGVQQAVKQIRAAQPDLRFQIDAILANDDRRRDRCRQPDRTPPDHAPGLAHRHEGRPDGRNADLPRHQQVIK